MNEPKSCGLNGKRNGNHYDLGREGDLKESAEFAVTYLRDALADDEPGVVALQHVARARGGIEDLELSLTERAELANAVSRGFAAIPGWYKTPALQAA